MSNEEVDEFLDKLADNIVKAIQYSTPTSSNSNLVDKYVNKKIERLHKKKPFDPLTF